MKPVLNSIYIIIIFFLIHIFNGKKLNCRLSEVIISHIHFTLCNYILNNRQYENSLYILSEFSDLTWSFIRHSKHLKIGVLWPRAPHSTFYSTVIVPSIAPYMCNKSGNT
jgi:hypothetical protein